MFRPLIFFVLGSIGSTAAEIPQGAHVLLRMENSINTRTAQEGDYVYLRTASPIAVDGRIAVPEGSYVQGVVVQSKRGGRVKGRAQLGIRLETLTLAGGKILKFSPHLASAEDEENGQRVTAKENVIETGPNTAKDAERIAIMAGSGAALGGLTDRGWAGAGIGAGIGSGVGLATVLLTRGKDAQLRKGSTLDVVFDRPVALE